MPNCTIYIVDDHRMFCDGLKGILESYEKFTVSRIFSNASDALEALNFEQPNIIIGDITMPKMSGIELAKIVKEKFPLVKFLMLSMHTSANYVKEAIQAGVHGYVPKDSKADEVINAIEMILNGQTYISPGISANLYKSQIEQITLTEREIEVLQHIALGWNTNKIADKLFISFHTVESHRKNLLTKTECANSVELTMWGVEKGYVKIKNGIH
jgi:DNA-binding NarL/FixJ family response regulator